MVGSRATYEYDSLGPVYDPAHNELLASFQALQGPSNWNAHIANQAIYQRETRQNLMFSPHRIPFQSAAEIERVRESAATGYLPHRRTDRSGEDTPSSFATARQERPWERRAAILRASTTTRGHPQPLPLRTGIPQPCRHPLHDQAAFQLRDGTQDGKRSRCAWKGFGRRDQRAESEKERAEATWKELRGVECVARRRLSFSGHALH